jgi:hypothetical protein
MNANGPALNAPVYRIICCALAKTVQALDTGCRPEPVRSTPHLRASLAYLRSLRPLAFICVTLFRHALAPARRR